MGVSVKVAPRWPGPALAQASGHWPGGPNLAQNSKIIYSILREISPPPRWVYFFFKMGGGPIF